MQRVSAFLPVFIATAALAVTVGGYQLGCQRDGTA
jgi:hypothetical protein